MCRISCCTQNRRKMHERKISVTAGRWLVRGKSHRHGIFRLWQTSVKMAETTMAWTVITLAKWYWHMLRSKYAVVKLVVVAEMQLQLKCRKRIHLHCSNIVTADCTAVILILQLQLWLQLQWLRSSSCIRTEHWHISDGTTANRHYTRGMRQPGSRHNPGSQAAAAEGNPASDLKNLYSLLAFVRF